MTQNPHINLVVAYVNILAAFYWLVCGQPHGAMISIFGARCSMKAFEWMRQC